MIKSVHMNRVTLKIRDAMNYADKGREMPSLEHTAELPVI